MNKGDMEFKKKLLQWVLDFIQLNLDSLPKSKFMELCIEAMYIASSYGARYNLKEFSELKNKIFNKMFPEIQSIDETELKRLKENFNDDKFRPSDLQDLLKTFSEETLRKIFKYDVLIVRYGLIIERKLPEIQKVLRSVVEEMVNYATSIKVGERVHTIDLPIATPVLAIGPPPDKYDFYFHPLETTPPNWACINLGKLMDGLESRSIMKCKGCNRYFLNLTHKKKIYCTFSCASRSIAHKKYEELKKNPKKYEAHLKKYRKLSSDRYKKFRQMQFGPHVKINHRKKNRKEK